MTWETIRECGGSADAAHAHVWENARGGRAQSQLSTKIVRKVVRL